MTHDEISLNYYVSYRKLKKDIDLLHEERVSYLDVCFNFISFSSRLLKEEEFCNVNLSYFIESFNILYEKIGQNRSENFKENVLNDYSMEHSLPLDIKLKVKDLIKHFLDEVHFNNKCITISTFDEFYNLYLNDTYIKNFYMNFDQKEMSFEVDFPKLFLEKEYLCKFQNLKFIFKDWSFFTSAILSDENEYKYLFIAIDSISEYICDREKQTITIAGNDKNGMYCMYCFVAPEVECKIFPANIKE